ncbi:MAG: CPBP family intramembrane metalloprotease [Oscillospiraceae bacterium]|nr:CPBP family intramembrane metalloprotease [Oscillospiraceae bacterium]
MSNPQPERFSDRALKDMSSAVLVLDIKENIIYVNQPASEILEVESGRRQQETHFSLYSDDSFNDAFHDAILDALYQKKSTNLERVSYQSPSGKKYVLQLSSSFLPGVTEEDSQLVVTFADDTEVEVTRQRLRDSSRTFSTFLFGFCIWILFYAFWEFMKRPWPADVMTHGVELLGIIMLLFIFSYTSLTWHDLGIMTDKPKETIRTGLIVAVGAVALLFVIKMIARLIDPNCFEPDAPFFDISRFGTRQIIYIFTAGIQEFLARSVIQGNLKRITVVKRPGLLAIFLSSLIFAALHIHLGFLFMCGAAILAGLEGILYEKQENIFGVWIVHWAFGVCGTLLCLIDH